MKQRIDEIKRTRAANAAKRIRVALAFCFLDGKGTRKNWNRGVELLRASAERGHATGCRLSSRELPLSKNTNSQKAQYDLAGCNEYGVATDGSIQEAVRWYSAAANQCHAGAQLKLGMCYANGTGVDLDEREAVRWYRRAALQKDFSGFCMLGDCYREGIGVESNRLMAGCLYKRAVQLGEGNQTLFPKELELGDVSDCCLLWFAIDMIDDVQGELAIVDAVCNAASDETREAALQWLLAQNPDDISMLVFIACTSQGITISPDATSSNSIQLIATLPQQFGIFFPNRSPKRSSLTLLHFVNCTNVNYQMNTIPNDNESKKPGFVHRCF